MLVADYILQKIKRGISYVSLFSVNRFGRKVLVEIPRRIENVNSIKFGNNVRIGPGSCLVACKRFNGKGGLVNYSPNISIGSNVKATSRLQVYCATSVTIEDGVLLASNVFICDYSHGHSRSDIPYMDQPYEKLLPIIIGKGTWIGQNVVIMPGVKVGAMSIIGANSVVTKSIPPYSMAVGIPARIIKYYDISIGEWKMVGA